MEAMSDTASDEVGNAHRDEQISETVVSAVAAAKGVDELDLDPLFTAIDPDALNDLFRPKAGDPSATVEVRFELEGCLVVVDDGVVTATPIEERAETPQTVTRYDR